MDGGGEEIVVATAAGPAVTIQDEGESSSVESTSDVLSKALDILDISAVTNEKPRTARPRSSPPITARRNNPTGHSIGDNNIVISFPTCAKITAHNVSAVSSIRERPKMTRLGSVESISTAATISTSASFEVSPLPSPTSSPVASPKRSIFQSYWERPKGTPKKHKEQQNQAPQETTKTRFTFSNVPKAKEASTYGLNSLPSTIDGSAADVSSASAAYTAAFKSSTKFTSPSTTATGIKTSPKRSIFGDRAMETAQRSSLPDLPSVAATFISETSRTRQVHKTASTGQLIKVRKSCLRRTALYSSSSSPSHGRGQMKKSASTTTTTIGASSAPPAAGSLQRSRSGSVQFDPEVRVYEFHRTDNHHHDRRSSNEWSHIFA